MAEISSSREAGRHPLLEETLPAFQCIFDERRQCAREVRHLARFYAHSAPARATEAALVAVAPTEKSTALRACSRYFYHMLYQLYIK